MNEQDKNAVRRLGEMVNASIDSDAALFAMNEETAPETVRQSIQGYLDTLKTRGAIVTPDIGVSVSGSEDDPTLMIVTLTGLNDEGNRRLLESMSRRGRDALPFRVPEVVPADLDPRLVAAMPQLNAYYNDNMAWGAVHIVLDDGNIEDNDVMHCIDWAVQDGDVEGEAIARLLREVTPEQRLKLHEWWYGSGEFREAA